jgi:hypothetical protein
MTFFQAFYDIHSLVEKDGEELELLAADGHLLWQATSAVDGAVTINHPVLFKRVELRFDPVGSRIHDPRDRSRAGDLWQPVRRSAGRRSDRHRRQEARTRSLRTVILSAGRTPMPSCKPLSRRFRRSMANFSTRRRGRSKHHATSLPRPGAGSAKAGRRHRQCRRRDHRRHRSPGSLPASSGADHRHDGRMGSRWPRQWRRRERPSPPGSATTTSCSRRKPTNEQLQIIRRLEHSGSVIVQGPPGTGKTHTIGNLIGHLLAQGKSILVTAHTAKALRVVRDKVPEILRPLAVSVLGSDQDARRHLESAIASITERWVSDDAAGLLDRGRAVRGGTAGVAEPDQAGDRATA